MSEQILDPGAEFARAIDFHRRGQLADAERIYRAILDFDPAHFDAAHLLGVIFLQRGQHEAAERQIGSAIAINSNVAPAYANRGSALKELGRFEETLFCYDRAIALSPGTAELFSNRGNVLRSLNRAHEALASFDQAIALKPDYAEAFGNRAIVLQDLQRLDEALASYDRAIALRPDFALAIFGRGKILSRLERYDEALASFNRAIALDPGNAQAFNSRAGVLTAMRRFDEALASIDRAIALKPDFALAFYNRGNVCAEVKNFEAASAAYEKAYALDPDLKYLEGLRLHAKMQLCDWSDFAIDVAHLLADIEDGKPATPPFPLLCIPASAEQQLLCARSFAADAHPPSSNPVWSGERYEHKRIRVGYFSADFFNHATAYLMAELFERHDRTRFEIVGFSFGPDVRDDMRGRLEKAFDRFLDVRALGDRAIAERAKQLEIDIAVDLKGFTANRRPGIFAERAAPVQVSYLGYPGTMGVSYMDYLIADATIIPPDHFSAYAEAIVHLPHSYQVNDSKRAIYEHTPARAEAGLPDDGFVFCCFNNNYKITPPVFDIWMRLLKAVEGSVLWLVEDNPAAAHNLKREAASRGLAAERLVFAPRVPLPEHLARHRLADLFLDTFYYTAHTTASDALWAGLPVLTLLGETFAGRVAASLLNAIGQPELIVQSLTDYEALALHLAQDSTALTSLRARLAANRTIQPLFDIRLFTRHLERAYENMRQARQNGQDPEHFVVAP